MPGNTTLLCRPVRNVHTLLEVGTAYVEVPPFDTPSEFLAALRNGKVGGHRSNQLIHLGSTWAKVVKAVTRG